MNAFGTLRVRHALGEFLTPILDTRSRPHGSLAENHQLPANQPILIEVVNTIMRP